MQQAIGSLVADDFDFAQRERNERRVMLRRKASRAKELREAFS